MGNITETVHKIKHFIDTAVNDEVKKFNKVPFTTMIGMPDVAETRTIACIDCMSSSYNFATRKKETEIECLFVLPPNETYEGSNFFVEQLTKILGKSTLDVVFSSCDFLKFEKSQGKPIRILWSMEIIEPITQIDTF